MKMQKMDMVGGGGHKELNGSSSKRATTRKNQGKVVKPNPGKIMDSSETACNNLET